MKRKEESLIEWQNVLSNRELKLESGEDNLCSLMREIRIKDSLLADKDVIISKKDWDMEDMRRECREDVRREVEVCCCVLCVLLVCYCVVIGY